MSVSWEEKKKRVGRLKERDKQLLDELMADPRFNLAQTAKNLNLEEGYVRSILTRIFKVLGVPEDVEDKRGYVFTEYKEVYKGQPEEIPEPVKPPVSIVPIPPKKRVEPEPEPEPEVIHIHLPPPEPKPEEPRIFVTPPPARRSSGVGTVVTILIVAVVIIGIVAVLGSQNNQSNSPSSLPVSKSIFTTSSKILMQLHDMGTMTDMWCSDTVTDCSVATVLLFNKSNDRKSISIDNTRFSLSDSKGNSYTVFRVGIDPLDMKGTWPTTATLDISQMKSIQICFYGKDPRNDNVTSLILTISNFEGISMIQLIDD